MQGTVEPGGGPPGVQTEGEQGMDEEGESMPIQVP